MKFILSLLLSLFMFSAVATATPPVMKEWTFLVYLNGDNNLDSYGDKNLKDMMAIGSNNKVNVLVLRDYGARMTSRILYVNKGSTTVVKDFNTNVDTGDYNTLVDFFKYAKENYPANHYFMDIWNHGNGWMEFVNQRHEKGISYDDTSGNHITTAQMGVASDMIKQINDGKNLDILGTDACLMAMGEIIHEIYGSVDYLVGSEETEPAKGWNYKAFLKYLVAHPTDSAATVSTQCAKTYIDFYSSSDEVTQSVIAVAEFEKALTKVNAFVDYSKTIYEANKSQFVAALEGTRSYAEPSYKDFVHYLELLTSKIPDPQFAQVSNELKSALKAAVVYNGQLNLENSNGISIWLPTYAGGSTLEDYQALKLSLIHI